jgi:hypothetical protein
MRPGWGLLLFLALSTLLIIGVVNAEDQPTKEKTVPEISATRINPHPPTIDGDLSDSLWQSHKFDFARDFRQMEPDEGMASTESTLVAVAYDDEAIYFAFWNYDSEPDKIAQQLVRRDRWAEADMITVRLDPYHDHQTGYRFELNAAGVQRDFRLFDDTNMDREWDGVWEGAAKIQPWGWSAEVRIPYHCLRFTKKEVHTWGYNVTRYISRKSESDWWAFSPSTEGGSVSQFGHLNGLSDIQPARHLQIMPYAVSSYENEPEGRSNPDGEDYMKNIGCDIKYGLTSNLTLDVAINPDFGQVEMDEPVLNLSAFETWYDEKRPFFLEGAGMYNTPFMLFYSRRIGRTPDNDVEHEGNHYFTDYPKATTIMGATKLTGKLANGTSIGFLSGITEEETAEFVPYSYNYNIDPQTGDTLSIDTIYGESREGMVEPGAGYSVLRIQQDLLSNSNVGVLLTNVSQDGRNPATTGGMDWRLSNTNSTFTFRGQTVFSRIDNEDAGFGMTTQLSKMFGKHFRGSIGATVKDVNLQINRLGYTSRNNSRRGYSWVQYRTSDDWFIFRNTYHNVNFYIGENYQHVNIEKGWNYNTHWEFTNNWSLGWGYSENYDEYDDMETRGNGNWKHPTSRSWWASLHTDSRKKVRLTLNPGSGASRDGTWWAHYTGLDFRPRSNMEYSIGANVYRGFGQTRWVSNDYGDESIFADLDQDRVTFNVTASITLRKNLSFQLSGQGYITGLDYGNYRKYLGEDEYGDNVELDDLDRNYSALNSSMIIRWEYLPGSTVYFVWSRAMDDTDYSVNNLDLNRDLGRLFSEGSSNVWLLKASYWWNI